VCFLLHRRRVLIGISALLVCPLASLAQRSKPKPCTDDLDSCPVRGCAAVGSSSALLNKLKRTVPPSAVPILLTLDDFQSLQDKSDDLVGQRTALAQADRKKLTNFRVSGGKVSEGTLVQVTGYLIGNPHPNNSGESVNCRLKGTDNNDFHIPLGRDPKDTEFDGVVVEMIPQDRPDSWNIDSLRGIQNDGHRVLIRGQLFYDNMHIVNNDPDNDKQGQPKRFSLWEVHPTTEFYFCEDVNDRCDPADITQWTLIGKIGVGLRSANN
jgi:hypothetical protein